MNLMFGILNLNLQVILHMTYGTFLKMHIRKQSTVYEGQNNLIL